MTDTKLPQLCELEAKKL